MGGDCNLHPSVRGGVEESEQEYGATRGKSRGTRWRRNKRRGGLVPSYQEWVERRAHCTRADSRTPYFTAVPPRLPLIPRRCSSRRTAKARAPPPSSPPSRTSAALVGSVSREPPRESSCSCLSRAPSCFRGRLAQKCTRARGAGVHPSPWKVCRGARPCCPGGRCRPYAR